MTETMIATASPDAGRPPYKAAVAVFAVVLTGYVWTLAPSVTFWDAGEFIATSKILGIPHPPGTPLFTLLAHVWARLVPIGEYAYRTNFMTAVFSAAGAALLFLMIVQVLRGRSGEDGDPVFTYGGGLAAALISAFVFTVWQNSNETEVYMVATFSIAATVWLAWLWRAHRGEPRAPHILLLIVFFAAVSLGNHLLALLVGPALIGFMAHVLKTEPLPNERDRKVEWGQWAVLTGVWALLIGTGLGNTTLLFLGGLVFVAAAIYAATVGGVTFAITVLGIAVVGASTYLFLYFRANVGPFINEADPSTWHSLWEVIQRKQYPPRSPLDNPIFPSGPDNPGRSFTIILLQIQNYVQYFDWQWANGLAPTEPVSLVRLPVTVLFTGLGIYGAAQLWERDRSAFWLLMLLFLTTGPGLMGYMNFKPGYSLGWDRFPSIDMHEVRERDYFFTVSFQTWGLFAGIGLACLYRVLRARWQLAVRSDRAFAVLPTAVLLVALVPIALNFRAATRKQRPEALLARDFSYSLLQSAEPYGVIFTNGDNDTFPLWYMQEVENVRQDVSVVNLSLANTDWYLRQLRDNPVRPFDPQQAPWFAEMAPDGTPPPLHSMSDADIARLQPQLLGSPLHFNPGRIDKTYPVNTPLYVKDVLMLRLIIENWNRRPIYYSVTAGNSNWLQLDDYLTQEALVLRVNVASEPDTSQLGPGVYANVPVNIPRTDFLLWSVYRYAGLFEADSLDLDPTNRNITTNLSFAYYSLGQAYLAAGETELGVENLRRAMHLAPTAYPQLSSLLGAIAESAALSGESGSADTASSDSESTDSGG
jgi:hypothetical protein